MILYKNVVKIYHPNIYALFDINLKIEKDEFVFIAGKSGSGKTTFLKLLIKEEDVTDGQIFFNGTEINRLKYHSLPKYRRNIGVIFQDYKLFEKRTVYENIAFSLEINGYSDTEIITKVKKILNLVELEDRKDSFPFELSGGERQRVAIARAVVHNPNLILADEPFGNLDSCYGWDIIQLLLEINKKGVTVILATHNKEIINNLKKRVIILDKGRVIIDKKRGEFII